jgi:acyl transferase domain-containing protein
VSSEIKQRSYEEVEHWLLAKVSLATKVPAQRLDVDRPFASYGLVSRDAIALSAELEAWVGREVAATALYLHPTIATLARHLSEPEEEGDSASESSVRSEGGSDLATPVATSFAREPVAIVGIGCRFPKAEGPDAYWAMLSQGVDATSEVPKDRWDVEAYYHSGGPMPGKMYTRRGGFLPDVAGFDPAFFGVSHAEASHMDPQQRLLLDVTYEALEDAGALPAQVAGTQTGVFVGITTTDYARLKLLSGKGGGPYAGTGNVFCMASNRLSYTFDLHGPSISLDTACSSSLVAVHQACMSLRQGESTVALAGGVNLMLSPLTTAGLCQTGALSPDGRCFTFDARGNGYARCEGAGIVVLKLLSRAVADGDRIYAVIRGTAVNQDGRSNGLTAPNGEAHTRLMRKACADAGVSPGAVQYVEAHGTGTALGDPIEAKAIGAAIGAEQGPGLACALGSVKSNFGHAEAAAGVAGLIKVALSLHHGQLPPSLHFETPNPHIDFEKLGLRMQTVCSDWPRGRGQRLAGVNSFGVGGTNAHAVLGEAPAAAIPVAQEDDGSARLMVLSARTDKALAAQALRLGSFVRHTGSSLAAVTYTAALRRTHHEYRMAVVARSNEELAAKLEQGAAVTGRSPKGSAPPRVVFVFTGQGPQYLGMGRGLLATDVAFRIALDACERATRPHLDWSVREELLAGESDSRLGHDEVAQVLLFVMQVCIAASWRAKGIVPDAVVGHSMGEVAAAYVAGALTLADAARVTCTRAKALGALKGQLHARGDLGAMAAVALPRAAVDALCATYPGRLHLAASNGPALSVVSGDSDVVADVLRSLEGRDVFCRAIKAGGAGHSPVVDPVARALTEKLADLQPSAANVPLYSSVTTAPICGEELGATYWAANIRQSVLFSPTIERLADDGYQVFLEISPNPALVIAVQDTLAARAKPGSAIASLSRRMAEPDALLEALGALHTVGVGVDFQRLCDSEQLPVSLPSGACDLERCWFEEELSSGVRPAATAAAPPPPIGTAVAQAFANVLRVHPIDPDKTFFDLGGTSIMAAQMLYSLRSTLQQEIPLRLLFENPTIEALTRALEKKAAATSLSTGAPETRPLERVEAEDFPLTINQERVLRWGLDNPDADGSAYVIIQHLNMVGGLDAVLLERALARAVEIHDGARTVLFESGDGAIRQRLLPPGPVPLSTVDLTALGGAEQEAALQEHMKATERRPFALLGEPLYRFALAKLSETRHVLSILLHHIITDGWSQGVFFQDFVSAYEALRAGTPDGLQSPPLRLVDIAHWERSVYTGAFLESKMNEWRKNLGHIGAPAIPWIRRRSAAAGEKRARAHIIEIDPSRVQRLEDVARTTAVTLQMVVLTGLMMGLRRHSGRDEITVPSTSSGRERPDYERVMGYLSQPRLITADFAGQLNVRGCLLRVRDAVLRAGEEQGLSLSQYYYLAGKNRTTKDADEIPFSISMNYLPEATLPTHLGGAELHLMFRKSPFTLYRDILLVIRRQRGQMILTFGYASELIHESDIARLAADMNSFLVSVAETPEALVDPLTTRAA